VIEMVQTDNGILPLSYEINGTLTAGGTYNATTTTSQFTGLAPGDYIVTATGANGCTTDSATITINELAPVTFTSAPVVTEFGCTTGNVTDNAVVTVDPANISGGSSSYVRAVFVYNNGTPGDATDDITQDSSNFVFTVTNEIGGEVAITVYDSEGCSVTTTATIAPFNPITDSNIVVNKAIDCRALPIGGEEITVSFTSASPIANAEFTITGANAGTTGYTTPTQVGTTATFVGMPIDVYTIEILNPVTGCILTTTHEVGALSDYFIDINSVDNVQCFGDSTGSVTFGFSSSTPYTGVYDYEVFQSSGTTTGITGNSVTGATTVSNALAAGDYYVVVTMTDAPFCPVTSPTFTIENPSSALSLTETVSLISCISPSSGEVILEATGGWNGYEYELINTTTGITLQSFDPNNIIIGLDAGTYSATVRDLNGCTETITFDLANPAPITGGYNIVTNVCNGEQNATITVVNVLGGQGTPPSYTYRLTYPDGTVSANQVSNVFDNLTEGDYVITIYDEFSCESAPINVRIDDPTNVVASATIVSPITCSRPEAVVEVTGQGGTGTYEYSTDGINFVSSNIFNVDAGRHQFYVRDANGCISDPYTLVTVDEYEALVSSLNVEVGLVTCNGDSNGVLSATVAGGFGNYEYELLGTVNRPRQTSNMFSNLPVGSYRIRVYSTNTNGDVCDVETQPYSITEPDALQLSETHTNISCFGGNDGTITIGATGGNLGGYEYNINPGFDPSKFVTTNTFENLGPGVYTITVKDKVGCIDTIEVEILTPTEITLTAPVVTEQICITDPTPTVTFEATGGSVAGVTSTYIVSVNGIDLPGVYNEGVITIGAPHIQADSRYGISVRNSNTNCTPVTLPLIETRKPIDLQMQVNLEYTCPIGNVITAGVQDEYKNAVVYTLLDNGVEVDSNDTGVFTNVSPSNNYTINVEHAVDGCPVTINAPDVQDIQELQLAIDDTQKNLLIADGNFGLAPYEYSFDDGDFSSDNQLTILETRDYKVTVRDARGCEVELIVEGVYITIEVPNLFTPDGNGDNDYWYPLEVEDYHDIRVFIYDRYARLITKFTGTHQGWDGTYEGRNLPSGDYWYTIYYKELSGQERKIMGHFTLYR
ncbi:T9SS type B sorting domain-containing protein, partial [Tenacibaculum sp. 190524A02b]|uniref:T9SS type B sorting domain-containing protein n=1 Tax=Tenacibaculum vairaonense TaxID=3137860 RepID=UPI0032B20C0D